MNDAPFGFYPWLVRWSDVVVILFGGFALVLALYLAVRGGREGRRAEHVPGSRPPLRDYAGLVKTDSHPMTAFIAFLIVVGFGWAIWYIVRTGALGLKY